MRLSEVPLLSGARPIVGHARELQEDRLRLFLRAAREPGEAVRVVVFGREVLVASSPPLIHEVFVEKARCFLKTPQIKTILFPLAGEGLFTSEGELWKRQRRLMSPIFQPSAIARYVRVVLDVVRRAAEQLTPGSVVDLGRMMTRITMGVVGKALFDADAFDEADELGEALTTALDWASREPSSRSWFEATVGLPVLVLQTALRGALDDLEGGLSAPLERARTSLVRSVRAPLVFPGAEGRRMRSAVARLDRKIQAMIEARRASAEPPDDLLTRVLRARDEDGSRMADRQVRDEAVTLFVAGYETTATALAWAFYELSRAPEARAKLAEEADAIRSDDDFRDPGRFPYALKVFKETMRLYPPVYLLARRARESVRVRDYDLARGSLVFTPVYGMHRRADIFPDPERFDPERFAPAAEAARPRGSYMPFGAGPRICLGNHFALMEGPLVLLALSRRFSFDVAAAVAPAPSATLRPKPIMATVRARATSQPAVATASGSP